jgi:hypothetical protein
MIAVLSSVTLFAAVLIVLDRLPQRWLVGDLMRIRVECRPTHCYVMIACEAFLFEWDVNGRDYCGNRLDGMRFLVYCENWWTRAIGEAYGYRKVVFDSVERSPRELLKRYER